MQHQRQVAWIVAILALTGLNGAAQTVTFSDQDFNDSDWTATVIIDETRSAQITAEQDSRGGNPGAFRRIAHVGEAGSRDREIHVAHLHAGATYDPRKQGPISSVGHSYDLKNLESRTIWDSTYYLLIFQNDTYYRPPVDNISRLDWTPFGRSGLEARDFTRVAGDGPRRPNFSDTAPPIQFGFASVSEFPPSGESPGLPDDDSRNSGIDNWEISIVAEQQQACKIVSVAPAAIDFGSVLLGAQSSLQTLRLVGSETALLIRADRSVEEFDVLETFERISETEVDLSLFFTPFQAGLVEGTITFFDTRDEGIAECSHTVALRGAGIVSLEPRLSVRPSRLSYSFVQQSPAAAQRFLVLNEGGGSASFQLDAAGLSSTPWLSVSPLSGEVTVEAPVTLTVEANPAGLTPNTYLGEIVIASPANSAGQQACRTCNRVPVAMAISSRSQLLRLSQKGLTFTAVAGGGAVPVQNLDVFNDGLGVMAWDVGSDTLSGGDWLTVTPLTGASEPSVPATVDVAIRSQGLTPGAYYGLLEVTAPDAANSPRLTTVVLNLLEGDRDPGPIVDPRGLIFASTPADPAPSPQSFRISNLTNRSIAFTLRGLTLTGDGWLSPTTAEGIVSPGEPANIGVEVLPEGLGAGIYRGLLTLQFDGELTRTVEVLLVVSPGAGASLKPPNPVSQAGCSRTEVAPVFKVLGGTSPIPAGWPASIEVEVVDNCAGKMTEGSVVVDFTNIASPSLALGHSGSGLWAATWNVPEAVGPDSKAVVTVTATDPAGFSGGLTQALSVSPNSSPPPRVAPGGVVHGASFVLDPLAPGTIVSIFGSNLSSESVSGGGRSASSVPLPTELAGTQIILGGRPLPILFSREDQVNAVLPFELTDRLNESLPLLVRRTDAGSLGVPEPVFVNAARPGVFTRNASGSGPGSIQNVNFQIVTPARPVKAGDAIIIYGTGLGAVFPEVASGNPAPASPLARTAEDVKVTIGGRPANVLFAGLTPGFTSLYQVNAVVPAGLPAGEAELVVSIAGQASPVVTLAVE